MGSMMNLWRVMWVVLGLAVCTRGVPGVVRQDEEMDVSETCMTAMTECQASFDANIEECTDADACCSAIRVARNCAFDGGSCTASELDVLYRETDKEFSAKFGAGLEAECGLSIHDGHDHDGHDNGEEGHEGHDHGEEGAEDGSADEDGADDDGAEGGSAGDGDDEEQSDGGLLSPAVCFPADATVVTESGRVLRMDEIEVGERIQTGAGRFSTVFSWSHRDPNAVTEFVKLEISTGTSIELSPGHYIVLNAGLRTARSAVTGDSVRLDSGMEGTVVKVCRVMKTGLYNPHTMDSYVAVNGVVASTYTEAVAPALAHVLLLLPRLCYQLGLGDVVGSSLHAGSPRAVSWLPKGQLSYEL
mmetsp:Transcript_12846/g.39521  ORF Transcript_12846/g.39521 Transcript_12846/m.39521 type:complete len:359 (+) Transcript_12846:110-1186(+)